MTEKPQPQLEIERVKMSSSETSGAVVTGESLSFDEISKLFSMPIAEAANILGVCSSVLKRICRDNGVVRWPYRKFLAGKSVEEIQKDAARERKRELAELSKADRQRNDASASSVVSLTSGGQVQTKALSSINATAAQMLQQQGNSKLFQNGLPNHVLQSCPTKNIPAELDEFKHGFPSSGLSTATNRWWGSGTMDGTEDEIFGEESTTDQVDGHQSQDVADVEGEFFEEEKLDKGTEKSDIGPQGTALLSSVRKIAAEEGREALKLAVNKGSVTFKLGRRERLLLLKVFKSSLPSQWRS